MLTIQFFGDISLSGLYCIPTNHIAVRNNLADIERQLEPCHIRIGNWETPLIGNGELNTRKKYLLTTTPEAADLISPLQLNIVTLANNHIYDAGYSGVLQTIEFLTRKNISYCGFGFTKEEAQMPFVVSRDGVTVALLNYIGTEAIDYLSLPSNSGVHVNELHEQNVIRDIHELKNKVDHIIVSCHWGRDIHYEPPIEHRYLARKFIEEGASLVYGGQSHIQLGYETWGDGLIFYSLGDFLFSPINIANGDFFWTQPPQTRKIGVPTVIFTKKTIALKSWKYFIQHELSILISVDDKELDNRTYKHNFFNNLLFNDNKYIAKIASLKNFKNSKTQ